MSLFVKNNLGDLSGKNGIRNTLDPNKPGYSPDYNERNLKSPEVQNPNKPGKSRVIQNQNPGYLNFSEINRAALREFPALLAKWLPDGWSQGGEWVARNPTRHDRTPGSFKINMKTGKWADFATGNRGGDVISLVAYLSGTSQGEAAKRLAEYLGVYHG